MPHVSPITCVDHHTGRQLTSPAATTAGSSPGATASSCGPPPSTTSSTRSASSDNGAEVAVAAADGYAYVLDAATGAETAALGPHGDDVNVVRWLPRGRGLVCTMDHVDPTVRVWERAGGRVVQPHAGPPRLGRVRGRRVTRRDPGGHRRRGRHGPDLGPGHRSRSSTCSTTPATPRRSTGRPTAPSWPPAATTTAAGCGTPPPAPWSACSSEGRTAAVRFVRFSADGSRLLVGAYDATHAQLRTRPPGPWSTTWQLPIQWERAAAFATAGLVMGSFGAAAGVPSSVGVRPRCRRRSASTGCRHPPTVACWWPATTARWSTCWPAGSSPATTRS